MDIKVGSKVVVTTREWFIGADGIAYRAAFGTVKAVLDDKQTLGIATNRNSTNWYLALGSMVIAGCQIHYVCEANEPPPKEVPSWDTHEGRTVRDTRPSPVYNADGPSEVTVDRALRELAKVAPR